MIFNDGLNYPLSKRFFVELWNQAENVLLWYMQGLKPNTFHQLKAETFENLNKNVTLHSE